MSNSARAIADVNGGTILASVDILVPPERVFAALSDGEELARWWGHPDAYTTERWSTDFRIGGQWRADGKGAGGPFHVGGEFLEIDPPWRIVQTWAPGWDTGAPTTVTYQLKAINGGTRLVVRHEGFKRRPESCEEHASGWISVLGWLAADIGPRPAADPAKYFVARLLAPRPDFATSLSADEMAMMMAHARYWQPLMAAGKVIALGPVNDPRGHWGLGLMRVASEAELLDLQSRDPAVLAGNRYENLPMFRAVWKQA